MKQGKETQRKRPELWVILMFLVLIAVVVGHLWVFHGPNREWALWLYKEGRFKVVLVGCGVGLLGAITSLIHQPLVQKWRLEGVLMALVIVFSAPVPYGYPSSERDRENPVELTMPVQGNWRVLTGGRGSHNPLNLEPDRCLGILLAKEVDGSRWKSKESDRTDSNESLTFGSVVYSPVDGEVVAAVGDEPDRSFQHKIHKATGRGNHLVIQLQGGEFLILAHLKEASLEVAVGARVQVGQALARVGSSGRGIPLTEPHLDVHVSTRAAEGEGEAVPFLLMGYAIGGEAVPPSMPKGGLGGGDSAVGDLLETL